MSFLPVLVIPTKESDFIPATFVTFCNIVTHYIYIYYVRVKGNFTIPYASVVYEGETLSAQCPP